MRSSNNKPKSEELMVTQLEFTRNNLKKKKLIKELEKKCTREMQDNHFFRFSVLARRFGNGVYAISAHNIYSTDLRELFLIFVAIFEKIPIKNKY